ncbi:alpha/beta hydrolase [Massilia psychrophila]|uniref:Esterase n=1 Tax=Massilia psychrophila TaxID=1603353 RepID=A0A2G8T3T7_9BURK|nr:alpha/beta hydrolase [Massilia psychrophila]PIL40707.1 esterase [Massilia psychrophila]GGE64229.1 esterase [Massilia psychrophila]
MRKLRLTLYGLAAAVVTIGGLAACSPLTAINALSPGGDADTSLGLAYGSGARFKLDIYRPARVTGASPVVVFFYGGNWATGERGDYAFVGRALASRGIVAVIPDYRLYPEVRYPDFLDDSAQAVAWTAKNIAHYGGDPRKLFLMGHSAGAYNAAMLALDARYLGKQGMASASLAGWIGLAGPYDFMPIENKTARPVFHFPDTPPQSQPINHTDGAVLPALLIAANKDQLVNPVRNTGGLAAKLRTHGVPVEEVYYDGVSHITLVASIAAPLRALAPTLDTIDAFVKGKSTAIALH